MKLLQEVSQHRHQFLAIVRLALRLDAPYEIVERTQRRGPCLAFLAVAKVELSECVGPFAA